MDTIIFKIMMLNEQIKAFRKDEKGTSMIEYILLAALIGMVMIAVLQTFEGRLAGLFGRIGTSLAATW